MTHSLSLIAAFVALSLTAAPIAFAQEASTDSTAAETSAPLTADTVTDAQIESFVTAAIALESLRKEYADKIGNAESEEDQNALRAEADRVAIQLVNKARGITAEEYLAISKAAQTSEDLTARISAQVDVMREQKAAFEKQQAEALKAQQAQRAAEAQKAAEDTAKEATTSE